MKQGLVALTGFAALTGGYYGLSGAVDMYLFGVSEFCSPALGGCFAWNSEGHYDYVRAFMAGIFVSIVGMVSIYILNPVKVLPARTLDSSFSVFCVVSILLIMIFMREHGISRDERSQGVLITFFSQVLFFLLTISGARALDGPVKQQVFIFAALSLIAILSFQREYLLILILFVAVATVNQTGSKLIKIFLVGSVFGVGFLCAAYYKVFVVYLNTGIFDSEYASTLLSSGISRFEPAVPIMISANFLQEPVDFKYMGLFAEVLNQVERVLGVENHMSLSEQLSEYYAGGVTGTGTPILIQAHLSFDDFYLIYFLLVGVVTISAGLLVHLQSRNVAALVIVACFVFFKLMRTEFSIFLKLYFVELVCALVILAVNEKFLMFRSEKP